MILKSTKFCQGLSSFKEAVVLPRSRTSFRQAWNLTDLSIYTPWFEGKCQSWKFDLYSWSIQSEARQNYFIFALQSNIEDGRFVPRYAAWRSLLRKQLLRFPSLRFRSFSVISRAKLFNFNIPMQNNQMHICMQTIQVSRVHVQALVVNKYFAVSQCAHDCQIRKFGRKNLWRFLEGPNKFCQSSASRPLYSPFLMNRRISSFMHDSSRHGSILSQSRVLYGPANDPRQEPIPVPQMIPKLDRRWS